jgi:hypothetical protein
MNLQALGIALVAVVCLGLLRSAVRLFYAAYRIRRGTVFTSRARLPDQPVPADLTDIDAAIRQLGFEPYMYQRFTLANHPKPAFSWVYYHHTHNIELSLAESSASALPFWVGMETQFADGALLITSYPFGQTTVADGLLVRFAAHSLQEAFDHHLLTQLGWTERHGDADPVPADDNAFFGGVVAVQARHGRVLYAPVFWNQVGRGVASLGYIILLIFLALQVIPGMLPDFNRLPGSLLLLMVGALLVVGGNEFATRGKKPVPVDEAAKPPVDPTMHPLNRPPRTT